MIEALTKAKHDAQFCVKDLRAALAKAGPVEGLVLLQVIDQAVTALMSIEALLVAVAE